MFDWRPIAVPMRSIHGMWHDSLLPLRNIYFHIFRSSTLGVQLMGLRCVRICYLFIKCVMCDSCSK